MPEEGRNINKLFKKFLDAFVTACTRHFHDTLIGVVLYGAHSENFVRTQDQVDLLVICESLPSSSWERYDIVMALLEEVETVREELAQKSGLAMYISPVLKTPDEVKSMSRRTQNALTGGRILWDKKFQVRTLMLELESRV